MLLIFNNLFDAGRYDIISTANTRIYQLFCTPIHQTTSYFRRSLVFIAEKTQKVLNANSVVRKKSTEKYAYSIMGNEESGMIEENSSEQTAARGGRRGVSGRSSTNSSSNSNNYGDYSANSASSARKRGGRRGHGGGSTESSGSKYDSSAFADKSKPPKSSLSKNKDDDMFSGLNLPLGETPKSISDKGRKAFNTAIWSPRADSNRSKARKVTNNNPANKVSSHIDGQMKPIEEKKKAKSKQEPDKKEAKPTFNFDSLYFNDSKPKDKKSPPKAEMDDDLFSNPFGVSGGSVGGSWIILSVIVCTQLSAHERRHVC